jgi:hypothetical protein
MGYARQQPNVILSDGSSILPTSTITGVTGFDGEGLLGLRAGWRGHVTDTQTKTATNRDSNKVISFPMYMVRPVHSVGMALAA